MPFKRPHSPTYRIRLNLPGYGIFPETSTHVTSMATARQMETMLRKIAEKGLEDASWFDLLDALRGGKQGRSGELTLPDLLLAHNEGTIDELRFRFKDPGITAAIAEFKDADLDYQTANGLSILEEMAIREFGAGCRLSVLRSGKNITKLCARAEREGGRSQSSKEWDDSPLSRNYVNRGVRNAASKLCIFHFGNAARDRIFSDVQYSASDDTRDIFLDARQLENLLRSCSSWFRPFVLTAALTGADRKPLLSLRVGDVDVARSVGLGMATATLHIPDTKNDGRPRTVTVVGPGADAIEELVRGREPHEKVFRAWFDSRGRRLPLTADRVRRAFESARTKAGFTIEKGWRDDLRFKDLRHTAGVAFERAGLSITEIGAGLGHKRRETSLKYTKRQVQFGAKEAFRVARQLGIIHDLPDRPAESVD